MFLKSILDAIENNKGKYVCLLQELVKTSKEGEEAVQNLIKEKLCEQGCKVSEIKYRPTDLILDKEFASEEKVEKIEHLSVVGKYTGSLDGKSLMFFAHPDSEPFNPDNSWSHDPYAAGIEGGRMYGWGVADDLVGVAIMIAALDGVTEAGLKPSSDLYLCSTPSKGNARGVLAVLEKGFSAEAAIYIHPAESGVGLGEIKAFASGMLNFKVLITGKLPDTSEPGHTAFAHLGINPIDKAFLLLESLNKLDKTRGKKVYHEGLDNAVGRSTNILISDINCGKGNSLTRMPEKCEFTASVSFPPSESLEEVQEEITSFLQSVNDADAWLAENPPSIEWLFGTQGVEVSRYDPIYVAVEDAVKKVSGERPYVNYLHTASDIRNPILYRGIPTLGLGPKAGGLTHSGGKDEWVNINSYIDVVKVIALVISNWGDCH